MMHSSLTFGRILLTVNYVFVVLTFHGFTLSTASEEYCTSKASSCAKDPASAEHLTDVGAEETIASTGSGMEWFSHGVNNNDLVSQLKRGRIIKSEEVESAMRKVDRGNFCTHHPYQDSPQYLGYGITISAPHMHAHALEMLKDKLVEGASVLDVGSGIFYIICDKER